MNRQEHGGRVSVWRWLALGGGAIGLAWVVLMPLASGDLTTDAYSLSPQDCVTNCQVVQTDCILDCEGQKPCARQCRLAAKDCVERCVPSPPPVEPKPAGPKKGGKDAGVKLGDAAVPVR